MVLRWLHTAILPKGCTIFEDSPLGLDKWMCAYWILCNSKNGVSSCEMARTLGITQKSAWFMLHRIRLTLQNSTPDKLSDEVEADEAFIGGKARYMHLSVNARPTTTARTWTIRPVSNSLCPRYSAIR